MKYTITHYFSTYSKKKGAHQKAYKLPEQFDNLEDAINFLKKSHPNLKIKEKILKTTKHYIVTNVGGVLYPSSYIIRPISIKQNEK